jgi:hypothetical protein
MGKYALKKVDRSFLGGVSREVRGALSTFSDLLDSWQIDLGVLLQKGLTLGENSAVELKEITFTAPSLVTIAPTLAGLWVNFAATTHDVAGYWIEPGGWVCLKGFIKTGVIPGAVLTLPVGYRPERYWFFPVTANAAHGEVSVATTGVVTAESGNNTYFSLAGIRFPAVTPACPSLPGGDFPIKWETKLKTVIGIQFLSCRLVDGVAEGLGGCPTPEWDQAAGKTLRIRNITGLVPGRRYKALLQVTSG